MNAVFQFFRYALKKLYAFFKGFLAIVYAIFVGLCILVYTVCKGLVMVIGFLSIVSYTREFFDNRPFKFEYLNPVELGQAFFDLRYPISPDLSLTYVLNDLKKAGVEECVERKLKSNESKKRKGYDKAILCVQETGVLAKPMLTIHTVVVYISLENEIKEIKFNSWYNFL